MHTKMKKKKERKEETQARPSSDRTTGKTY
jgi:hypothetical protein